MTWLEVLGMVLLVVTWAHLLWTYGTTSHRLRRRTQRLARRAWRRSRRFTMSQPRKR